MSWKALMLFPTLLSSVSLLILISLLLLLLSITVVLVLSRRCEELVFYRPFPGMMQHMGGVSLQGRLLLPWTPYAPFAPPP